MKWVEEHTDWVGLVVAFIGGLLAASFWINRSTKEFWDVASAVGTVAAVVVALFFAVRGEFRAWRDTRTTATITAAGMRFRLVIVDQTLTRMISVLMKAKAGNYTVKDVDSWLSELAHVISWSLEDERAVASLPDGCAQRLAMSRDRVRVSIDVLTILRNGFSNISPEARCDAAEVVHGAVYHAQRHVSRVQTVFQNLGIGAIK